MAYKETTELFVADFHRTKAVFPVCQHSRFPLKPGFHKANFGHDDQLLVKTKRLVEMITAQAHNRFVFCVLIVEFAVNGNQTLRKTFVEIPRMFEVTEVTAKSFATVHN